jgi:hypothetical protein
VKLQWLTAFVDLPADRFGAGSAFWQAVTNTELSEPRGDTGQFVTMVPPSGDAYLRAQRTEAGPRVHLDLHVDSTESWRVRAEGFGATLDVDLGHVIMRSPAGLTFCFVPSHDESERPAPAHPGLEHRLDQICIDVPADRFETEGRFWAELTGWDLRQSKLAEFASLAQPSTMPLRLLFQRLGLDDPGQVARAHLDVACGDRVDEVRRFHEELGAEFVSDGVVWTTMRDPGGMLYCLTKRQVDTGLISG